jgi:hypothetical protein
LGETVKTAGGELMSLLSVSRRSYFVASAALFAVIYAILGLFPVTPYVGIKSFLSFREVISPLAGMLFGPVGGGFSMILGGFVDFALGKPVVFDYLDFVPDLASALLSGLVFTGRRKLAIAFPLILILWFSLDPLSIVLVYVGGVGIPFLWLHVWSVVVLVGAFVLESKKILDRFSPVYVGATTFAATMAGHVAGGILFENIVGRVNDTLGPGSLVNAWYAIFFAYPAERILFTVLGTMVAVPVLRGLSREKGSVPTASQ